MNCISRLMLGVCVLVFSLASERVRGGSYVLGTRANFTAADGSEPDSLTPDGQGGFLGTTMTSIFQFNPATGAVTKLASIGGDDVGGLVPDGPGVFYGTTTSGGLMGDGSIFRFDLATHAVTTVVSFTGPNGANPSGPLISDGQGNLLGTTEFGGASSMGTVFSFNPTTSALATLASFNGANGFVPLVGLVAEGQGDYLGTTSKGGTANEGTVFSFNPATGVLTALVSFTGPNGALPSVPLVSDGQGHFLGTTAFGGPSDDGTIFSFNPSTSALTTLVNFDGQNGRQPRTALVPDGQGDFLGTTDGGLAGDVNVGTIFLLNPTTSVLTRLGNFAGPSQSEPVPGANGTGPSSLLSDGQGDFFGTTAVGGAQNFGTIFELSSVLEPSSLVQAGLGILVLIAYRRWTNGRDPSNSGVRLRATRLLWRRGGLPG